MKLNVVLGWPQLHAVAGVESGPEAWRTVLEIARELGDTDYELRALWALWVDRTNSADHRSALSLAEQFLAACARGVVDAGDDLVGHRMAGRSLHLLGRQDAARDSLERMLEAYGSAARRAHAVRFQYDQRATAQSTLARVLLLQGQRSEAIALARTMVAETAAADDLPTLCHVLSDGACLVAMLAEDWELAVDLVAMLRERSGSAEMDVWSTYGMACAAVLLIESGQLTVGLDRLATALSSLEQSGFVVHFAPFRAVQSLGLARDGRIAEALVVIEAEIARCRRAAEGWYLPELLRIAVEIAASAAGSEHDVAALLEAFELAAGQGAFEWQLRLATSLASSATPGGELHDRLARLGQRGRRESTSLFAGRLSALLAGDQPDRSGSFTTLY